MSAEKKYSLRDMVLAQRKAFQVGVDFGVKNLYPSHAAPCEVCEKRAAHLYPLPKVTRPRVVKDSWGIRYRLGVDGWIETHSPVSGKWANEPTCADAARIRLWADLLANPTETVDAEE